MNTKLNDALINTPVLRFFDPRKQVVIQADASKDGLKACLLREGHPAAYASRASTETEKNYAQIAKELLAIVFSVRKFHQCVFGVRVDVQSDHKPLENILRKPLGTTPSRLLQRHDLNLIYTPGKELLIADTLSRVVTQEQHTSQMTSQMKRLSMLWSQQRPLALRLLKDLRIKHRKMRHYSCFWTHTTMAGHHTVNS